MRKFVFYLIVLSILLISFSYLHFYVLDYKELQLNALSDKLTVNQFNTVKIKSKNFEYFNLVSIPLSLLIKSLALSIIFFVVSLLLGIKLKFQEILNVNIKAEFVFLLPILYEIVYFNFIASSYTITDINNFSSLSVLNAFGYKNVDTWFIYPLQTLNLFELGYCFLLVYFLIKITKISRSESIKIVAFGYIPAMILWITIVMFFTLNK